MPLTRETPLTGLPGVGPARAKKLEKLGLHTLGDTLEHLPQRYEDRRACCAIADAPEDRPCCISAVVAAQPRVSFVRRGLSLVKVRAVDGTGTVFITFFNQDYIREVMCTGQTYVFYGTVERQGNLFSMTNPVFEREGSSRFTGLIMPVYPLTAGISNNLLAGLTRRAVDECLDGLPEVLPARLRKAHQLCQIQYARKHIHYPASFEELAIARRRLVFEELFILTCGLAQLKDRRGQGSGRVLAGEPEAFTALLPFAPTGAQRRAMEDIAGDLRSGKVMNRLVQGDVGSGKTAVAAYGAWTAARNGVQCAMMAPTELLAEQHARTLERLLSPAGVRVALLTALRPFVKEQRYAKLDKAIQIAKQHRFGVAQRSALAEKGGVVPPHVLVMSATPIPRTLALIVYGDLDVSVINELPPGRTPVKTVLVGENKRQSMYGFVRKQAAEGRQVYIVCPSVEENGGAGWEDGPSLDLKAVTAYARELSERVFPDLRVGFVHGRLKSREKEAVMSSFAGGGLDVLVSTTVIEVGVDVPNASLMIIENAERFGLSQLHQLRGRVGRGTHESWCVLVTSSRSETARERLKALCATNDGFEIAEKDFQLRGPGDLFGTRQHGLPQLKVADFAADMELLKEAQAAAEELIAADPELKKPSHRLLKRRVRELFEKHAELLN